MAEYMNKVRFLSSMGLAGDETKYGNRDSEHSNRSYSTWMGYEIMDSVDDSEEENAVLVVRCKDCKHFSTYDYLGKDWWCDILCDNSVVPDFYCARGERKDNGKE